MLLTSSSPIMASAWSCVSTIPSIPGTPCLCGDGGGNIKHRRTSTSERGGKLNLSPTASAHWRDRTNPSASHRIASYRIARKNRTNLSKDRRKNHTSNSNRNRNRNRSRHRDDSRERNTKTATMARGTTTSNVRSPREPSDDPLSPCLASVDLNVMNSLVRLPPLLFPFRLAPA